MKRLAMLATCALAFGMSSATMACSVGSGCPTDEPAMTKSVCSSQNCADYVKVKTETATNKEQKQQACSSPTCATEQQGKMQRRAGRQQNARRKNALTGD